jgi:hypothetical protein
MVYQIGIGEFDNCYIITSGLTGLASFEPILVDASAEPVLINVDAKDENIFTPFIKQSLDVNIIKYSDNDYAEILAGEDNTTFGILIENGELELVDGDLQITSGGILKFIGTLLLETYIESYRNVSEVRFTFHDRFGVLNDEDYFTVSNYNAIYNIIAEIAYPLSCSGKLYFEWEYIVAENEAFAYLNMTSQLGKKKIDVLEQVLKDFGLQLFVDFEANPQTKLVDCGALRIRHIENHSKQNYAYYEFTLSSEVGVYYDIYIYEYSQLVTGLKYRQLLASDSFPLIDNNASLSLERMASKIVAKNECENTESLVHGGIYDIRYEFLYTDGHARYVPLGIIIAASNALAMAELAIVIAQGSIEDLIRPEIGLRSIGRGVVAYTYFGAYCLISQQIIIPSTMPSSFKMRIEVTACKMQYDGGATSRLYATVIGMDDEFSTMSYWTSGSRQDFTLFSQLQTGNYKDCNYNVNETLTYDISIADKSYCKQMMLAITLPATDGTLLIKDIKLNIINESGDNLETVILNTVLIGDNRKAVEINPVFMNRPNLTSSELLLNNLIADYLGERPLTVSYRSLDQTMLAHLSDIYGVQYQRNRWNLEATAISTGQSFNLMGQFGLDEKILMLLSGVYDARKKIFKGKWGQVLELDENLYRLLDDTFIPLEWDDGNYIMLN